jgi:predicted ATPase
MVKPRTSTSFGLNPERGFYRSVQFQLNQAPELAVPDLTAYPLSLPVVKSLRDHYPDGLPLNPAITVFCGENGSGKSTLLEAIAAAVEVNPEGGSRNIWYNTRVTSSTLFHHLKLTRTNQRELDAYFLRAECMYNVATVLEELDKEGGAGGSILNSYGGVSLHDQSHGESFFAVLQYRLKQNGFYVFDEPEAALSPDKQFYLLRQMHLLAYTQNCQIVIATHSPILMACPGATLYQITDEGITLTNYRDTEAFRTMCSFLNDTDTAVHILNQELRDEAEAKRRQRRNRKTAQ